MLQGYRQSAAARLLAQRWRAFSVREQFALAILLLFVLVVGLYLQIWLPTQQRVEAARGALQVQRELNAYMQVHAPRLNSLSQKPAAVIEPSSLQRLVTASAVEHGLGLQRLDNDNAGALQISMQAAPFSQLLPWIIYLQEQGVQISAAVLDREVDSVLAARFTLRATGSQ